MTVAQPIPAPTRSAKYRPPMPSGCRPNRVAMMTPGPTKEAKIDTEMTRSMRKLRVEPVVPYSQTASVSMRTNATMTYATTVPAALMARLQKRIWSVAARLSRLETATTTPPLPMPSSASPMTR
jgi:hypothetical protein